ncbi:hypothetical protein CEXT_152511 [Caerostris extrusa]|uniref:Uncharacterized protein n=1 Tax=Caerostris extrusa TaxID=172846 RepID=A0AAV4VRI0_CAEEX|nr:hypothetical protein CEXT_152511 [Caerostris extrusa]
MFLIRVFLEAQMNNLTETASWPGLITSICSCQMECWCATKKKIPVQGWLAEDQAWAQPGSLPDQVTQKHQTGGQDTQTFFTSESETMLN